VSLPFADLERILRAKRPYTSSDTRPGICTQATDGELGEEAGVSARTIQRLRAQGNVDAKLAERLAENLGMHPVSIWGFAWWSEIQDDGTFRKAPAC
jgi:hypothetical protein